MANHPVLDEAWRLHQSGDHKRAAELYHSVLREQPGNFDAYYLLGLLHGQEGRFEEAQFFTGEAARLNPMSADAQFMRSYALRRLDRNEEALVCLNRVLALNPSLTEALMNRAAVLVRLQHFAAAVEDYERLLAINPDYPFMLGHLVFARLQDCDWRKFDAERAAAIAGLQASKKIIAPFHAKPLGLSPEQELNCARIWTADQFPPQPPLWNGETYSHQRIRIAYISGDFRPHPVASLLAGVFEHHDKARFETIGVAFGPGAETPMRSRIAASFEHFFDVHSTVDTEVAAMLKKMEVDIAIDLTGFTDGCRAAILAQRPAPVQVNFLGFPGTMGADYIDYLIADAVVVPEADHRFYAEKIVNLPGTFLPAGSAQTASSRVFTRAEMGLPERGFVFCCFNASYKIAPDIFGIWMRLLRDVQGSVLWLGRTNEPARQNLRREAEARGIAGERLIFASYVESAADHLARLKLADLFLDTSPYNAHATALDALSAGLPVLTCRGRAFAGRVGASVLHALGVSELITESLSDYQDLALALARAPSRLGSLKAKLASPGLTAALFDTAGFTRKLEAAYTGMWQRRQSGLPPAGFTVSA
ncbi:MAG TPA: tetratricopeptide repeat protein [Micropepsaceae bacterium]|nr:tetratricopeptide repeat protein [Micropepsaceae bacterium]